MGQNSNTHGGLGPKPNCSSRAQRMLEAAQNQKSKAGSCRKAKPTPKRPFPSETPVDAMKRARFSDDYPTPQVALTPGPPRKEPALGALSTPHMHSQQLPGPPYCLLRENATCTQMKQAFQRPMQQQVITFSRKAVLGVPGGGTHGPVGLVNLGNTCYLNAVLQVLLSLPGFVGDLRLAHKQLVGDMPPGGVAAALLDCAKAKDSSTRAAQNFAPVSLKQAMGARMAAFEGAFQQDAHEFFCGLLDVLQGEVVGAEVMRLGRPLIRISETTDPAARSFSFAVCHELTCRACGHSSRVTEEYLHLSLELPPGCPSELEPPDANRLLQSYFQDEELEKRCEGCGAEQAAHRVQHSIKRLPRVLALHMKRFQISLASDGTPTCQKLHRPVQMPLMVRLGPFVTAATLPPLAPRAGGEAAGKENCGKAANQATAHQGAANQAQPAAVGTAGCAAAAAQAEDLPSFYNTSAAVAKPSWEGETTPPATRLHAMPHAPCAASALAPSDGLAGVSQEDLELQKALQLSALEFEQQQQGYAQQQQQTPARHRTRSTAARMLQPLQPLDALLAAGTRATSFPAAASADCHAGLSSDAVQAAAAGASAASKGAGRGLAGVGGGGVAGGLGTQEDRDFQLALQLSLRTAQHQPSSSGGQPQQQSLPPQRAAGAAGGGEEEDSELERALQLSLLECQPGGALPPQQEEQQGRGCGGPQLVTAEPPGATAEAGKGAASVQPLVLNLFAEAVVQESDAAGGLGGAGLRATTSCGSGGSPSVRELGWGRGGEEGVVDLAEDVHQAAPQAQCMGRIVEDDVEVGSTGGEASAAGDAVPAEKAPTKRPLGQYELHAVINHSGSSALCGHFTADVRDPLSKVWHRHNDAQVSRIAASEATGARSQRECYMLFYVCKQ